MYIGCPSEAVQRGVRVSRNGGRNTVVVMEKMDFLTLGALLLVGAGSNFMPISTEPGDGRGPVLTSADNALVGS